LARLLEDRLPEERVPEERVPEERLPEDFERDELERDAVDREPPERAAVEREPDERDALERLVLREPERAVPEAERELLRVEPLAEARDCVSASRSLSKSLSACLLVLAASRRSARSAVVTSL